MKYPMKRPVKRMRGYATGGQLSTDSLGKSILGGFSFGVSAGKAGKGMFGDDKDEDKEKEEKKKEAAKPLLGTTGDSGGTTPMGDAMAVYLRGGKIRKVAGKPFGKEDGLIGAQRGEYVVKKSAVKKLGTKAMNQINKGRIPQRKGR